MAAMDPQDRQLLYRSYASTHAGTSDLGSERLLYERDVAPHLRRFIAKTAPILDIGCGQGELIACLERDGYGSVAGYDISAEQVEIAHANGHTSVRLGGYSDALAGSHFAAIVAMDFLEHLPKREIIEFLGLAFRALAPDGPLIVRSPNADSPFATTVYADFTHETPLSPRSLQQVGRACGFERIECFGCGPFQHSVASRARSVAWRVIAATTQLALRIESGRSDHIVTDSFVGVLRP
jgi:SAM-dependent methyltransferase